jgi:peroxiredoxin
MKLHSLTTLSSLVILAPWLCRADPIPPNTDLRAGHSHEGEAFNVGPRQHATLIPGTGDVHFPIQSSWPEAQAFFHQGVGQLHGFWYFEAERTFRHIAAHDPHCAMAYWGMAMANWENPKRAAEFINKAMALKSHAGPSAALWIEAQHRFHHSPGKSDIDKRKQLIRDLENIIHQNPQDVEAKAFLVCRIWQFSRLGIPLTSHEPVDALLQQILLKHPLHPAHHYRIHLWDEQKAQRALDSATLLASTAPAIAHMWHMPGHIYSRLHRYADSAWHQQASARVDHRWMLQQRILPDQIHNYVHNQEWLIRNWQMLGHASEALAVSRGLLANPRHPQLNAADNRKSSIAYGRLRHLDTLQQFELWSQALDAIATGDFSDGDHIESALPTLRLRGIAYFELAQPASLQALIEEIHSLSRHLQSEKSAAETKARALAEKEKKNRKDIDQAAIQAGRPWNDRIKKTMDLHAEMTAHLALWEKNPEVAWKNIHRPKHVLARLHHSLSHNDEALRLSQEAVDEAPGQTLPLATRIEILHANGQENECRAAFASLQAISAHIDLSAPPFARITPIAQKLGAARDWRVKNEPSHAPAARPDLDTLGPRDWTPPPAPPFSLPETEDHSTALSDYRGKPLIVLFYLGHQCLHWIEQLNAFAPQYQAFRSAGIEIIAISTDSLKDLQKSHLAYEADAHFPFPILADPSLEAFQAYRAYDDFEKKPLHGTFLIDPRGRVLWQDIGPEPFSQADFLLKESQRLLKIHSSNR